MQKNNVTILFFVFLTLTRQMGWQGKGNMSSSNLTDIWTFINGSISSYTAGARYDPFNTALSNHLNSLWAPAWNVFTVVMSSALYDTVVYGYAFNNHWMWFNNYQINGNVLAFIIWKDYNCDGNWKTVGVNGVFVGFDIIEENAGSFVNQPYGRNDVWNAAVHYVDTMIAKRDGGYSVVVSQDEMSQFYGRICVESANRYYYLARNGNGNMAFMDPVGGTNWGNLLAFQTR